MLFKEEFVSFLIHLKSDRPLFWSCFKYALGQIVPSLRHEIYVLEWLTKQTIFSIFEANYLDLIISILLLLIHENYLTVTYGFRHFEFFSSLTNGKLTCIPYILNWIKILIFDIYFERWVILLWVLILFMDENILLHSVHGVSFGKCLSSMWYDNFEKCFSQYGQNPGPLTNSPTQKIKMIDPSVSNKCILFI